MKLILAAGFGLLTMAALTASACAQTTIGTTANGAVPTGIVGSGFVYLGQVFTAPSDSVLENFSVQLSTAEYSTDFSLYAFDESTGLTTGAALFSSGPVAGVFVQDSPFQTALVDTYHPGGLALTAGSTYVALIQNVTPNLFTSMAPNFFDPTNNYDYYPEGFLTAGSSPTDHFQVLFPGSALVFQAQFGPAAVPEASTTISFGLLLALGLGSLLVARKKKAAPSM